MPQIIAQAGAPDGRLGALTLAHTSSPGHILGGAVIGASAAHGVIDTRHQVFGHSGMYVVDASAIRVNLGVNPSLTITALAERSARLIPAADGHDEGNRGIRDGG